MIRLGYDASTPPADPPRWSVCGFYIGGNTPHVWTIGEIHRQPAPWLAPLWVARPDSKAGEAAADMQAAVQQLATLGAPHHITVWVDTEEWLGLGEYLLACQDALKLWGYDAGNYASLDALVTNPLLDGGRWSAHWTDQRKLDQVPGIEATQFADAAMLGTDYDGSVWVNSGAGLWRRELPQIPGWADHVLGHAEAAERQAHRAAAILRAHGAK